MEKRSIHTNRNGHEKGATNELALSKRCQSNSGYCRSSARFYWPSQTKFPIIAFRAV